MQDEEYKEKFALVYRHFPIPQIHPNANAASATAEAAGLQGKFWEMWDLLFKNQAEWSAASSSERNGLFEEYASGIGLDMDKFKNDYSGDIVSKKIKFDRALALEAKVTGTPTLFVNGQPVEGTDMSSTEALKNLIDEALGSEDK